VQLAEGPERALEQLCEQVNRFIKRHITEVETLLVLVDGLDEAVHLKGVESENVVRLTGLLAERMYAEAVSVLVSTLPSCETAAKGTDFVNTLGKEDPLELDRKLSL
jgi:hypothetical protein